jgi:hypothetical protein
VHERWHEHCPAPSNESFVVLLDAFEDQRHDELSDTTTEVTPSSSGCIRNSCTQLLLLSMMASTEHSRASTFNFSEFEETLMRDAKPATEQRYSATGGSFRGC